MKLGKFLKETTAAALTAGQVAKIFVEGMKEGYQDTHKEPTIKGEIHQPHNFKNQSLFDEEMYQKSLTKKSNKISDDVVLSGVNQTDSIEKFKFNKDSIKEFRELFALLLDDPSKTLEKKEKTVIILASTICSLVAIQPLPFADILILTPIQLLMVRYLGNLYGFNFDENKSRDFLIQITGVLGWGVLAQQGILGLYKTVIPYMGSITTIPLVFIFTMTLGYLIANYFKSLSDGKELSATELKNLKKTLDKENKEKYKDISIQKIITIFTEFRNEGLKYKIYKDRIYHKIENPTEEDLNEIKKRFTVYENITFNNDVFYQFAKLNGEDKKHLESIFANIYNQGSPGEDLINRIPNSSVFSHQLYSSNSIIYFLKGEKRNVVAIGNQDEAKEIEIVLAQNYKVNERKYQHTFYGSDAFQRFLELIDEAEHEVDIMAPNVNFYVINNTELLSKLRAAIQRGVIIKVNYGFDDNYNGERRIRTQDAIKEMHKKLNYSSSFKAKEGHSHIKALIIDEKYYYTGSYNLLTRYDENMGSHEEQMDIITDKKKIIMKRADLFNWD